jgi:hypothetical protein
MIFKFVMLCNGDNGKLKLTSISDEFEIAVSNMMGKTKADARAECEEKFQELVNSRHNNQIDNGQILLFTSTIGDPPGSIIATELITSSEKHELTWNWHDGSHRI